MQNDVDRSSDCEVNDWVEVMLLSWDFPGITRISMRMSIKKYRKSMNTKENMDRWENDAADDPTALMTLF
jgi:hypothetical protein